MLDLQRVNFTGSLCASAIFITHGGAGRHDVENKEPVQKESWTVDFESPTLVLSDIVVDSNHPFLPLSAQAGNGYKQALKDGRGVKQTEVAFGVLSTIFRWTLETEGRGFELPWTFGEEIRNGRKTSHWIWWVWPSLEQVRRTSRPQYSLRNLGDVKAFLADPGLRRNLCEISEVALSHLAKGLPPGTLFGSRTDVEKFEETATCFALVALEARDLQLAELMLSCLDALGQKLHSNTAEYLLAEGLPSLSETELDLKCLRSLLVKLQDDSKEGEPGEPAPSPASETEEPAGETEVSQKEELPAAAGSVLPLPA
ncbi:unnamed protein product [Symbiodinium sp. CCMP2592]|nr:unnamed protein product [Symbiodinium sp. CCMP2592]